MDSVSALQELLIEYAVTFANEMLQCKQFCELLSQGGDLPVDLAKMQAKYLFLRTRAGVESQCGADHHVSGSIYERRKLV